MKNKTILMFKYIVIAQLLAFWLNILQYGKLTVGGDLVFASSMLLLLAGVIYLFKNTKPLS